MLTAQTSPGGVRTNRRSPGGVRNKHRHPTRTPNTCGEGRQAPAKTDGSPAACGKRKNRRPAATARVRQTRQRPRTAASDRQSAPNPGVPGKRSTPGQRRGPQPRKTRRTPHPTANRAPQSRKTRETALPLPPARFHRLPSPGGHPYPSLSHPTSTRSSGTVRPAAVLRFCASVRRPGRERKQIINTVSIATTSPAPFLRRIPSAKAAPAENGRRNKTF